MSPRDRGASHASRGASRPRSGRRRFWVPSEAEALSVAESASQARFRAFILGGFYSGLRLFELAALEVGDLHVREDGKARVHVEHGKGDVEGWSIMWPAGVEALLAVAPPVGGLIFRNEHGNPYSRQFVADKFQQARRRTELRYCTFHTLRHAHACWLIDQGATDIDVAIQLRHADAGELVRRLYGRHRSVSRGLERLEAL